MADNGLVIIYTGNGKGKTTAAMGLMLRAWGNNLKVVMLQFVKSQTCGEHIAAQRLGIEVITGGAGFVFDPAAEGPHRELAMQQWREAMTRIKSGQYRMVVLDELTYPLNFGWVSTEEVIATLRERPAGQHVVITGRNAPQALVDFADTVVELQDIKHHFARGIKAQAGIEF